MQHKAGPQRGAKAGCPDESTVVMSETHERLAWQRLRQAIVEEYVEKLREDTACSDDLHRVGQE